MRLVRLPGVFEPHSDSWMLARCVSRERLGAHSRVLDMCAGSGVLAVAAAIRGRGDVVAVDVSRLSVFATRLNAKLNGVTVRAVRGDLFEPVRGMRFDLIVSNPPYLPSQDGRLPRRGPSRAWEAGSQGRVLIDRICAAAAAYLDPGGTLLLVHSSVCGEDETILALNQHGLRASVIDRRRGALGPRLRARAGWLRERGVLGPDGQEDMVVIKAQRETELTATS